MKQEKIIALEKTISQNYNNTTGIMVLKNGIAIYEKYFNECSAASKIHIYSVTKSIISILVGIAIDHGYIKDINCKVLDFFPDYTIIKEETAIQDITIKHLLTMTAPYKYKLPPYLKYFTSDNFVKFTLDLLGGKGQIGKFRYTPLIGPDILSGILVKATGQSVIDFAAEQLFSPLGITIPENITFQTKEEQLAFNQATDINGWVSDSTGINTGGWGLTLTLSDMAKIGQLYLNNGIWNGKQIVSPKWVTDSITKHNHWKKHNLSYGYLWWLLNGNEYAAMGDGGNIIYINPEKELIVAIAALFVPKAKERIEFIKEYIEPIFED